MNRVERFKGFVQKNPFFSGIVIVGTIVISVATFFHSVDQSINVIKKYRPKTVKITTPSNPGATAQEPEWQRNAKNCITWVLTNHGARNSYLAARTSGLSRYESVLCAEKHDAGAQQLITAFGERKTEEFLASR